MQYTRQVLIVFHESTKSRHTTPFFFKYTSGFMRMIIVRTTIMVMVVVVMMKIVIILSRSVYILIL